MTAAEKRERHRLQAAAYRVAHPDRCAATKRKYYLANRGAIIAKERARDRRNPEAKRERARKYAQANPEKKRAGYAAWARRNPVRVKEFAVRHLEKRHGLPRGAYGAMSLAQDGGCLICGGTSANGRALALDHDHATGVVRGLLCDACNRGLGAFADMPHLLERAILYLRHHAGEVAA